MSNRLCKLTKNIFMILMFFVYFYILLNILFNNKINWLNNIGFILLFGVIFVFIFYILFKFSKKINITKKKVFITFLLFIIIQLIFAALFVVVPTWDFGIVNDIAINDAVNSIDMFSSDYIYIFGNNIGITMLLKLVFSIFNFFGIKHFVIIGILLNILFIDAAVYFLYKLLTLVFKEKVAFLFLLFSLIFTPFILYVPIYYTDTLSIPFAIGALYFFYKYEYTDKKTKFDLIISSILIGIGACIKFTVIFIGIAILINYIFCDKKEVLISKLKKFIIIAIIMCIPTLCLNTYSNHKMDSKKLNELKMPYTHWLMMGLTGNGGYNPEDPNFSQSFNSVEAKKKANIKEIKVRLKDHIDNDFVSFYTNKILYTWGDGTFFAPGKLSRKPKYQLEIGKYIYGDRNMYLKYFGQAEWIFILIFILLGIVFRKYLNIKQRDLQFTLYVLCFGLLVFFALWEARSRYLVNMIPLLLLTGYLGMQATYNYLKERKLIKHEKR